MQTRYSSSNTVNKVANLLQLWYLRLALCGFLLLIVSILMYFFMFHPAIAAPVAGPCDPTCAPIG